MRTYFTVIFMLLLIAVTGKASIVENVPNIMLRVVHVPLEWTGFYDITGWTKAVTVKESEKLKYYEATIWEETASVHLYAFPNDYNPSPRLQDSINERIAYREQFVRKKYTDMPAGVVSNNRSNYLKDVFVDIAAYLVKQHPHAEHHLTYHGHGAPGGDMFALMLNRKDANTFLKNWTQDLGKPLGVIDMGGPCNKAGFEDLRNFCEYTRYYIASDLLNGGYSMDDWTFQKYQETNYELQYHNLFAENQTLEEVLRDRLDLNRKRYEYSKNNMTRYSTQQASYLFSCKKFLKFYPRFLMFLRRTYDKRSYKSYGDLFRYMLDNDAPQSLINQYNATIIYNVDNKDFFEWTDERNGMLLPAKNELTGIYINGTPLPVTMSSFHPVSENGQVVIRWTTESELDNAGFNLLRSETRDSTFKRVNTALIQGAGTTGERQTYKWIDTTAKPEVAYYYQIEDVSFAGERQTLTTTKLKGLISAKNKLTTRWGALKQKDKVLIIN